MIPSSFKNVRKALANLRPAGVLKDAERPVLIGLTASSGERAGIMESYLVPPDLPVAQIVDALRNVYHTQIPGAPAEFDLEIQDEALPRRRGAFEFHFDGSDRTVKRILRNRPDLALPLARLYPPFRAEVCDAIVRRISKENALFSLATALPNIAPSIFSLPWAAAEFASDTAFLTANQVRMAFLRAAANGREIGYAAQKPEMGTIAAGAVGWRALARELVGKVPLGGGLIPKAAVAYAGTFVVGKTIVRLQQFGRGLSQSERDSEFESALARGKRIAAALFQRLQAQRKRK